MIWVQITFWMSFLCNFVYYWAARRALAQLRSEDPGAYSATGAVAGVSALNSTAIVKILFDGEMPKEAYSSKLKLLFSASRALLIGGLGLLALMVVLMIVLPSPE